MAVPRPPPDLGGNTFIFGADSSKKRPGLVPGKVQSGISPHSQAQDLSNTTSISTPAATLPWLEIAGLGTGEENYWGKEAPKPQILPQGMSYAGPMGAYPMLYTPHKRGFWAKISDWWDGEPYQGNVSCLSGWSARQASR